MIKWRMAQSDDDAKAIGKLIMLDMYREVGRAPLDPNKTFVNIYASVQANHAAMIFDDEKLVGSLGLVVTDFWYSEQPQLVEQWAYITKAYRDGEATRALFSAARMIAHEQGFPRVSMMIVFNEKRAKSQSPIARIGEKFDFRPAGSVISIEAAQ